MRQYFTLNHQVTFYTPSTGKDGAKISTRALLNRTQAVADLFSQWFGGATIERVKGFYKAQDGRYIVETINKVISFTDDKALDERTAEVIKLAAQYRAAWYQETIGLEIDGRFMLID